MYSNYFYEVILELEKANINSNSSSDCLIVPLVDKIINSNSEINADTEMKIILKFIYINGDFSKISKEITSSNCLELLSLSKSLGIDRLSEKLSDHIVSNFLTKENSLKIYLDSLKVFLVYFI